MRIWAISDLHLSFGVPNKGMDVFGPAWEHHAEKIEEHWRAKIHKEDLVLLAGDLSWAMRLEEALPDLLWVDALPGTKVLIKGNHDFWWDSLKKMAPHLPPSIHLIQNNAFTWQGATIGGARLWDSPEYSFQEFTVFRENPRQKEKAPSSKEEVLIQQELSEKLFNKELERLKLSLEKLDKTAPLRIAMTHYPPIDAKLERPSRASQILEQYRIDVCVFGHLHNIGSGYSLFGKKNGIAYELTSCDYLRFQPILIR